MASAVPTLAEVKDYLRIDSMEEDTLLTMLLDVAIAHAENYLYGPLPAELPLPIKQALLLLVGHFYEQRLGEDIPTVVYVLLAPYREPRW